MHPILTITGVSKNYGKLTALDGVSFEVPAGAVVGILGPNGSGKTTLLSIILDVLHADTGKFSWFGNSPQTNNRKQIGSLLETPNFYHYLSAVDNLKITQAISGRGGSTDIDEWYWRDLTNTINQLERIFALPEVDKLSFYYSSSW